MAAILNAVAGNVMDAAGVARTWDSGVCECTKDTGSCCDVYLCTSCNGARQCNAIDGQEDSQDMMLCCAILILNYQVGFGTLAMILRYRLIAKYNISAEGVISTFFISQCCNYCSMCQTHRQLTHMLMWPGGTCCGTMRPGLGGLVAMK